MPIATIPIHLGASYQSYEHFQLFDTDRWVRYRPPLNHAEMQEAIALALPLVHPVKDNDWIRMFDR